MLIRHVVALDNLDKTGSIRNSERARHAVIVAGRVFDLSGDIDPLTHLNLDYPQHRLAECVVVERLEKGAAIVAGENGPAFAYPLVDAFRRRGPVDFGSRRSEWLATLDRRKTE
ncbi:MAG TPA: hypothetical protein VMW65_15045 [Chloroflexota bacterium]|nr:hypothetical protein [Chloroflexota bacterium]